MRELGWRKEQESGKMSSVGIFIVAVVSALVIPVFDLKPSGRKPHSSGLRFGDNPSGFKPDPTIRHTEFLLSEHMLRSHGHGQRMRSTICRLTKLGPSLSNERNTFLET